MVERWQIVAALRPIKFAGIMFVGVVVYSIFAGLPRSSESIADSATTQSLYSQSSAPRAPVLPPDCAYRLVASYANYRDLFVSKPCLTKEAMTALGGKIRTDFAHDGDIVIIGIYDDLKAAKMGQPMIDAGGSLGAKADRFYDRHLIGSYSRNSLIHRESYKIMLQGFRGPAVEISF